MSAFTIHPLHERYVTTPGWSPSVLENFFDVLESLDELERDRMFTGTFMFFDFGNYFWPDEPSWEAASRTRFDDFKDKCRRLKLAGLEDEFLLCGVVTYTLATLYSRCNCDIESERQCLRERLNRPFKDDSIGSAESAKRHTEEKLRNIASDLVINKIVYNSFCEKIVAKLIPSM